MHAKVACDFLFSAETSPHRGQVRLVFLGSTFISFPLSALICRRASGKSRTIPDPKLIDSVRLLLDVFAGILLFRWQKRTCSRLQILNVYDAVVFSYLCRGLVKKISSAVGYIAVQSSNFAFCLSAVSASFLRASSFEVGKFFCPA